jgi:DNA-binding NtrC family response regulator
VLFETSTAVSDLRVLVVEGDESARRKLFSALLDKNVFSDTTADAGSALDCLRGAEYGVVILDLLLAGSAQLLEAVRKLPPERRPMVIGTGDREVAHELDDNLVQIVIRKPIALRQFADVVRSCIEAAPRWRRATATNQSDELRTL